MSFPNTKLQLAGIVALVSLLVITGLRSCMGEGSGGSETRPVETVQATDPDDSSSAMSKIIGAGQQGFFEDEKGNRFFPWGFNYTNTPALGRLDDKTQTDGLIDDDIHADAAWHIIEGDFAEMKDLAANAVRIHLQYNRFMLDPQTVDPRAFDALERMVDIAEENQLYLIITGLGAYRKEDSPAWYDSLPMEERWDTQALFWKTVANRVGDRPAVFAYDLMNEPVVCACDNSEPCGWLPGEPFGGFYFVQNISVEPQQDPNETMVAWIHKLTEAIRAEDSCTLITIGSMAVKPLAPIAEHLDFVSPHIHPRDENMQTLIDYVLSAPKDKPLVLEEFFNLYCSIGELESFLRDIDGRYAGLFGHYSGRTLDELADEGDAKARMQREFLTFFVERNPNKQQVPDDID